MYKIGDIVYLGHNNCFVTLRDGLDCSLAQQATTIRMATREEIQKYDLSNRRVFFLEVSSLD